MKKICEENSLFEESLTEKVAQQSSGMEIREAAVPVMTPEAGEKIYQSETNAFMILGPAASNIVERKRGSSTITLAAGVGTAIKEKKVPANKFVKLSPYCYYDSAVISISEQTDPDVYWGSNLRHIPKSPENNSGNSSAIVLKADELRLYSRGTIKLVTRVDQQDAKEILDIQKKLDGSTNEEQEDCPPPSHKRRTPQGIWLIANDEHELTQPMVKGANLSELLTKIIDEISTLHGIVKEITKNQMLVNDVVRYHSHMSAFSAEPLERGLDPACCEAVQSANDNLTKLTVFDSNALHIPRLEVLKKTYLNSIGYLGINSRYNKVN